MSRGFAGIDGGGTHSRILSFTDSDEGIVSIGDSTNIYSVGLETAIKNTISLIAPLSSKLGSVCLASAGLGRPEEKKVFKRELEAAFPFIHFHLCSDAEALIAGSSGNSVCAGLILGTGSIAIRLTSDGHAIRRGGLGWRLGDEGSGWFISEQAVRRTLRSIEKRDLSTTLLPIILNHFHLDSPSGLVPLFNSPELEKSEVASLAPAVIGKAVDGDILANDIISQAAREAALLVKSLFSEKDTCPINYPLVLAGGLLEKNSVISQLVKTQINDLGLYPEFIDGTGNALQGAALIARSINKD
ncbi:MAG: BadF/BadG/BcrA/BcrD ATPase family protein [Sphaerochaetaceae bacterium]|nr:BadF/BadG/BcrA/BcrD ATPase family protein [Sphaerochaetaceae bacterium]